MEYALRTARVFTVPAEVFDPACGGTERRRLLKLYPAYGSTARLFFNSA